MTIRIFLKCVSTTVLVEEETRKLTDSRILKLSEIITTGADLRKLGLLGLKLDGHIVQKHLTNNKQDITSAAFELVIEWRKNQSHNSAAYKNICYALIDAGLELFINALK